MNKQGKTNWIVILVIVGAVIAGYLLFSDGKLMKQDVLAPGEGKIVNGFWDEATQECRSAPNRATGTPYVPGQIGVTLYQCCFNQARQQVDCNNPSVLLGPFAIYQGQAGLFYITHGITITNTGNVDITNAWVDSAIWSPSNAVLTTAYSSILGSTRGVALGQGLANDWSTGQIDLQVIGGTGTPITYTLSLVTKGSASGLADFSRTSPATVTVEQEGIGFDVSINLGA